MRNLRNVSNRKKRRTELYAKLEETSRSKEQIAFMHSSVHLGKMVSKKEMLKRLLLLEKSVIYLDNHEENLLFTKSILREFKKLKIIVTIMQG